MSRLIYLLPPLLWTVLVSVLSLMSSSAVPSREWMDVIHADKFVHAFMYGILYLLYLRAFLKIGASVNVIVLSSAIAIFTGFVIEMLQWQMEAGRCFELLDIISNITGVLVTALVIKK